MGGYAALEPRSKAPKQVPHRTAAATEEAIVRLRKELSDQGLDAGAETIRYHLGPWYLRLRPTLVTTGYAASLDAVVRPSANDRPQEDSDHAGDATTVDS